MTMASHALLSFAWQEYGHAFSLKNFCVYLFQNSLLLLFKTTLRNVCVCADQRYINLITTGLIITKAIFGAWESKGLA